MAERKLEITTKKNYKNIDAYSMNNGDHFFAKKRTEALARQIDMPAVGENRAYSFWSAMVTHENNDCSFIIKKKDEAAAYDACGGVGDTLKVTLTKEMYVDKKGVDRVAKKLSFEKV